METWAWLAGLWLSAFSSATVLPGNSEVVFAAALHYQPQFWPAAWVAVSVGNIMGGMITVWMGRALSTIPQLNRLQRYLKWAQHLGPASLLFSWVPMLGDALCGLAGCLRWPQASVLLYLSLGKIARYGVIVWLLI